MRSPLIIERMGVIEGITQAKRSGSTVLAMGLDARPRLQFEYVMSLVGTTRKCRRTRITSA